MSPIEKPSPFHASPGGGSSARRKRTPPARQLGDTIARLTIPRLETDLYVMEGDGSRELRLGPGHLQGTAMPGGNGNCIIAGHRDTHFRALKDIRKGDEIVLTTHEGAYTYRVETIVVVSPGDTRTLRPTQDAELHLVTCYPFHYLGSAPKRFIVEAHLEKSAAESTNVAEQAADSVK